jgi:hypothetical protein
MLWVCALSVRCCVNCNPPDYLRARNIWFVVVERYLRILLGCSPYGAVVRRQLIEGTDCYEKTLTLHVCGRCTERAHP